MKRISYDTFINGNWSEDVYAIRVLGGELYMKAWVEEWPDAGSILPEGDMEYYRIMESSLPDGIKMELWMAMLTPIFDSVTASGDYKNPLYFHYEAASEHCSERADYKSVYACLCSLIKPYERNGLSDGRDYEILVMTAEEFHHLCDILRDGDYIVVISKE